MPTKPNLSKMAAQHINIIQTVKLFICAATVVYKCITESVWPSP